VTRLILTVLTCLQLLGCGTTETPRIVDCYQTEMSDEYRVIYVQFLADLDVLQVPRQYVHTCQLTSIRDGKTSKDNSLGETVRYTNGHGNVLSNFIVISTYFKPMMTKGKLKYLMYHELVHAVLYQFGHTETQGLMFPYCSYSKSEDEVFADLKQFIDNDWRAK
jgi:hypothetical protein